MLKIDIRPGERVRIGDVAVITLDEKSGKMARLSIEADKSVPIKREGSASVAQIAGRVGLGMAA